MQITPGSVLIDRVSLVGEQLIPREAFEGLGQEEWGIWLTEPDPEKFPQNMKHLRDLLYKLSEPYEE